ncbi:MAG: ABC transporter ATP-binding protein [Pseudomonadota bacterium]
MNTLRHILAVLRLIPKGERGKGLRVLAIMCVSSLMQGLGIISIMPFLIVLSEPDVLTANAWISGLFDSFGLSATRDIQIFVGGACLAVLLASSAFKAISLYAEFTFVQSQRYGLSARMLRGYMRQPYTFFLDRKASDLTKTLLAEVDIFVDRALLPTATVINNVILLVVILILLLVVNPGVTLVTMLVLGGAYWAIFLYARPRLAQSGSDRYHADKTRSQTALESTQGIKAIKISGREQWFTHQFEEATRVSVRSRTWIALIAQLPRNMIEAVAFGGIVILALVLTLSQGPQNNSGPPQSIVPMLAIFAFAGYRMLPALQWIYHGLSDIRYMSGPVADLTAELAQIEQDHLCEIDPGDTLAFQTELRLDGIGYHYPSGKAQRLKDLSVSIKAGSSTGIVGRSGSGKTTLIDVILGLLEPQDGQITVDGTPLTSANIYAWQRHISYVPQDIFLASRSVAQNIAFGIEEDEIDMDAIIEAAKAAELHDFIVTDLPQGYDTQVGERGLRLSGGQRQRLGIARALYSEPSVVVFDEATSAMDTLTEAAIMRSISELQKTKTVILVAHRLSTIETCDQILVMENGQLAGRGSYSELAANNPSFQALLATHNED